MSMHIIVKQDQKMYLSEPNFTTIRFLSNLLPNGIYRQLRAFILSSFQGGSSFLPLNKSRYFYYCLIIMRINQSTLKHDLIIRRQPLILGEENAKQQPLVDLVMDRHRRYLCPRKPQYYSALFQNRKNHESWGWPKPQSWWGVGHLCPTGGQWSHATLRFGDG